MGSTQKDNELWWRTVLVFFSGSLTAVLALITVNLWRMKTYNVRLRYS